MHGGSYYVLTDWWVLLLTTADKPRRPALSSVTALDSNSSEWSLHRHRPAAPEADRMMARAPPSSSLASVPKGQRGIGSPGDPPAPPPPGQATALFYLLSLLQRAHDDRRSVASLHTRKGTRPLTQTTQSGGGSTRLLSTLEWKTRYLSACLVRAASRVGGAKGEKLILQSRATTPPSARRDSHMQLSPRTHVTTDYPCISLFSFFLFLFFPCYTVQVLSFFFFSSFLFLRSNMWWSSLDNFFYKNHTKEVYWESYSKVLWLILCVKSYMMNLCVKKIVREIFPI